VRHHHLQNALIALTILQATVSSKGQAVLLTVPGKEHSTVGHITWKPNQQRLNYNVQLLPCSSPQYKGIDMCTECQQGYTGPITCPWLGYRSFYEGRIRYKYLFWNNNFSNLLFEDLKNISPDRLLENKVWQSMTFSMAWLK
jgi:hypothetical protein